MVNSEQFKMNNNEESSKETRTNRMRP